MFQKILIANRGEIALRIIRACKELGIKTVAVYSKADELSLHTRFADEAICIGPHQSSKSYLNIPAIISAAELTNVDAIHPGYGFLSESAEFSSICKENNIIFLGPSPEIISTMGNKSQAKTTMVSNGVPVIPGSNNIVANEDDINLFSEEYGFPLILKASAGGGGKGMRVVNSIDEISNAFETAQAEAKISFNNDDIYIEKFIKNPRHIEVQILADQHSNVYALGERECSIQRRHQKMIEESPSIAIDDSIRKSMSDIAIKACKAINYVGAGTIEFLVDENGDFFFMEMNTRIQVEHPVSEFVFSTDILKHQILCHCNVALPNWMSNANLRGHSIECRVNAEDPSLNFMPSPGEITSLHLPNGYGIRVDTHIYSGYKIPPFYDSMIAKVIVHAPTRKEAILKMISALTEFVIEGVKTNIPFQLEILNDVNFQSGKFSTNFLETFDYKGGVDGNS